MFIVRYENLRIAVSYSAAQELSNEDKTLYDVLKILDEGYDAPRKRSKGTIERWLDKADKTYNVVIVKDYDEILKEEVWVLIHFGKFTKKKIRRKLK